MGDTGVNGLCPKDRQGSPYRADDLPRVVDDGDNLFAWHLGGLRISSLGVCGVDMLDPKGSKEL